MAIIINIGVDILKEGYRNNNNNKLDKVFKNGPSKICGRQSLKHLKRYDLSQQTISLLQRNTLS